MQALIDQKTAEVKEAIANGSTDSVGRLAYYCRFRKATVPNDGAIYNWAFYQYQASKPDFKKCDHSDYTVGGYFDSDGKAVSVLTCNVCWGIKVNEQNWQRAN